MYITLILLHFDLSTLATSFAAEVGRANTVPSTCTYVPRIIHVRYDICKPLPEV